MWIEVETAGKEKRRELALDGKEIQNRIKETGIDLNIFKLESLNYLNISEAGLTSVPDQIGNLTNLTQLCLKGNNLASLPDSVSSLVKLKLLDVSKNRLSTLPDFSGFVNLTTLNLSLNKFEIFPDVGIDKCKKLNTLDLSVNDLTDISTLESSHLELLADLNLCRNELTGLNGIIKDNWPALKKFNLSDNKIKQLPAEMGELIRIKELSLINNPLKDNRLKKMTANKPARTLLDYISKNGVKMSETSTSEETGVKGKGKSGKKSAKESSKDASVDDLCDKLSVLGVSNQFPEVIVDLSVKDVRPFLVTCFVKNLDLTGENFRKFLKLQTKMHQEICENRKIATIATHDLKAVKGPLRYTTMKPDLLLIEPLNSTKPVSAVKLVDDLLKEAEAMRKDKKRNQISGIHQFVHLLDGHDEYPCLKDSTDTVLSFPPITNSGVTKISEDTTAILIEVTSSTKLADAKIVADNLLREILELGLCSSTEGTDQKILTVHQGRVLDDLGILKVTYPSKTDLIFEEAKFSVERN